MIVTTTNSIEGQKILEYKGIVVGEAIMGANVVRDLFASITDIVGGRSGAYEAKLQDARDVAMRELQQRAAALGAKAGNLLQGGLVTHPGAPLAMPGDGKAVRLIANLLQQMQGNGLRGQYDLAHAIFPQGEKQGLLPCPAADALGNADELHTGELAFIHHAAGLGQLPLAPVNQQNIGHLATIHRLLGLFRHAHRISDQHAGLWPGRLQVHRLHARRHSAEPERRVAGLGPDPADLAAVSLRISARAPWRLT